jgi:hypothetical protein
MSNKTLNRLLINVKWWYANWIAYMKTKLQI